MNEYVFTHTAIHVSFLSRSNRITFESRPNFTQRSVHDKRHECRKSTYAFPLN